MSRMKEQKLWDAMRDGLLAVGGTKRVRLERIENLAGSGAPDVLALCDGVVTWCELKAVDALPLRPTTRVLGAEGLSLPQRNWHMSWHQAGGRALIIVGVGQGRDRMHFAVEGRHGDAVNDMALGDLNRCAVAAGQGLAFWPQLAVYLKGNI